MTLKKIRTTYLSEKILYYIKLETILKSSFWKKTLFILFKKQISYKNKAIQRMHIYITL